MAAHLFHTTGPSTYEARQLLHSVDADDQEIIGTVGRQRPLGCPRAMGQTEQHLETKGTWQGVGFQPGDLPPWASRGHTVAPGVMYGAFMVIYWDSLGFPRDFIRCFYMLIYGDLLVFDGDLKLILR